MDLLSPQVALQEKADVCLSVCLRPSAHCPKNPLWFHTTQMVPKAKQSSDTRGTDRNKKEGQGLWMSIMLQVLLGLREVYSVENMEDVSPLRNSIVLQSLQTQPHNTHMWKRETDRQRSDRETEHLAAFTIIEPCSMFRSKVWHPLLLRKPSITADCKGF